MFWKTGSDFLINPLVQFTTSSWLLFPFHACKYCQSAGQASEENVVGASSLHIIEVVIAGRCGNSPAKPLGICSFGNSDVDMTFPIKWKPVLQVDAQQIPVLISLPRFVAHFLCENKVLKESFHYYLNGKLHSDINNSKNPQTKKAEEKNSQMEAVMWTRRFFWKR